MASTAAAPAAAVATAPIAPTAAAAELPTLSQQVVTAVDQALYDRVMGSLKVSHTATEPPPELLPAELDDVLRLTQQMLNRKAMCTGRLCRCMSADAHWECAEPDEPDCTAETGSHGMARVHTVQR